MENTAIRDKALKAIQSRTEHLGRVQELAQASINDAGKLRARAIKDALEVFTAKELSAELGISVQRVYSLARGVDDQ